MIHRCELAVGSSHQSLVSFSGAGKEPRSLSAEEQAPPHCPPACISKTHRTRGAADGATRPVNGPCFRMSPATSSLTLDTVIDATVTRVSTPFLKPPVFRRKWVPNCHNNRFDGSSSNQGVGGAVIRADHWTHRITGPMRTAVRAKRSVPRPPLRSQVPVSSTDRTL